VEVFRGQFFICTTNRVARVCHAGCAPLFFSQWHNAAIGIIATCEDNGCWLGFSSLSMKPKRTILCVDANEPSLSTHKIMLETRGYRVLTYTRSEAALARFRDGGVDLLLSSVNLPGMDGQALVAAVKLESPHTPAILLSDRSGKYDPAGVADVFLSRGMFAPADLLERIRLLLVRKRGPRRLVRSVPAPASTTGQFGTA
jgi:CheY-like chemotaxis protein